MISKRVSRHNTQEVCPFNVRFAQEAAEPSYAARGPGERPAGVEVVPGEDVSDESDPGTDGRPVHPGTDAPSLVGLLEMSLSEGDPLVRGEIAAALEA
ncbi:MAG: hypothetical protein EA421_09640 [Gemmatimonadales bacterium]|nr:MAG: hypothetical protein EA421_09640 [Gemmatimonadales bacterium]